MDNNTWQCRAAADVTTGAPLGRCCSDIARFSQGPTSQRSTDDTATIEKHPAVSIVAELR
jgi:hypothetical protein